MNNKLTRKVSFSDSKVDIDEIFSFCSQVALDKMCERDSDKVSIHERLTRYENYSKYILLNGTTSVVWERKFVTLKYLNDYEPTGIFDFIYSLTTLKTKRVSRFIDLYGLFTLQEHPSNDNYMLIYTTPFSYVKLEGGEEVVPIGSDVKKFTLLKKSMIQHSKTKEFIPTSTQPIEKSEDGSFNISQYYVFFREIDIISIIEKRYPTEFDKFEIIGSDEFYKDGYKFEPNRHDNNLTHEVVEENFNQQNFSVRSDKPPSKAALKLIGVLLVEMVYNDKKFNNQSDIINYIANVGNKRKSGNKVSGLGKENLEKLFSKAKNTLVEDIPHVKIDKNNYRRVTEAIDIENESDKKK